MSSGKRLVVVCGSTGAQGSAVVDALSTKSDHWRIRCLTRNLDSPKAKTYQEKGFEVMKCNLLNESDILNAFEGAHAVFAVTNFWDPVDGGYDNEVKQGKLITDVAVRKGVK